MDKDIKYYENKIENIKKNMEQEKILITEHEESILSIKSKCEYVDKDENCKGCSGGIDHGSGCNVYKIKKTTELLEDIERKISGGINRGTEMHRDVKKLIGILKGEKDAD